MGKMTDDRDYYLNRANAEDEAARASISLAARWRHEELASLYRTRVLVLSRGVIEEDADGVAEPFILVGSSPQTEAA
jgi:hypothetical protein